MKLLWPQRYSWKALGVPLIALAGLAFTIWQGTQFEIRPTTDRTPFLLAEPRPSANDWPGWRGPTQDGAITGEFLPAPTESHGWPEVWRTSLGGRGGSAPCLWGERAFVVVREPQRQLWELAALNRTTGAVEWRTPLGPATEASSTAGKTQVVTATPTCDGERVYAPLIVNRQLTMSAVSVTGRIVWQQIVGPARGNGPPRSSPTLAGPLVVVAVDQARASVLSGQPGSYLAGLHRQTGAIVYRLARPNGDSDSTPVVAEMAGRSQLLLSSRQGVQSYDPATGRELWRCRCKATQTEGAVAFDDLRVYAAIGETDSELLCIRADGDGDVTASHVEWRERRPGQKLLSPLVTPAGLLVLSRDGVLTAIHRDTGKPLWQRRSLGACSLPPWRVGTVGVGIVTDEGQIALLNADRRGEALWEGLLGHAVTVSPAICAGRLILVGPDGVRCLGQPSTDVLVQQPPSKQPL